MNARKPLFLVVGALALASVFSLSSAARPVPPGPAQGVQFSIARIYWEYNASANDLGVHVTLDGEDWARLEIENPRDRTIFQVKGGGPYRELGMTELFFEGAEPSLDEFPLQGLLDRFPEGLYEFSGFTVDGEEIESTARFSHAIPDGPEGVDAIVGPGNHLRIVWSAVTAPPPGFPNRKIDIAGYQVIVEPSFQVTLPATALGVTVSPEFVQSLGPGVHHFEVLAIEKGGNQTLTEGTFTL